MKFGVVEDKRNRHPQIEFGQFQEELAYTLAGARRKRCRRESGKIPSVATFGASQAEDIAGDHFEGEG